MFGLEITFLTGRYVATAYNDRSGAEWPPHPARLYSALVAAHFGELDPDPDGREALLWLERQGAPEIVAPDASARDVVTVFVPVNDTSVLGSLDNEQAGLLEARTELDQARSKGAKAQQAAEKKLAKAEAKLRDASAKAMAVVAPGKEATAAIQDAASLLPERRKRQPRTFPSASPRETTAIPKVTFFWPETTAPDAVLQNLDTLASRVCRIGHSSSLVAMRVLTQTEEPRNGRRWSPLEKSSPSKEQDEEILRVVLPGQLEALTATFGRDPDRAGRVMPAAFQRYGALGEPPRPNLPTSLFGDDWVVFRRVDGPRLPSYRGVDVARTLRRALMASFGEGAPEIISGHHPSGSATDNPHLAYWPLPFVAHDRAEGSILGVALVFPRSTAPSEREAVLRALEAWKQARMQAGDVGADGSVRLPLFMGPAGTLSLVQVEDLPVQINLRSDSWSGASRLWMTATPVALDRNPGELRSSDPDKEARAFAEAEDTIATACERVGLPRPDSVTATMAAPLAGGDKVRAFPPFKAGKPAVQRVLVHATLKFKTPVRGPIALGSGRFFGLGLLRPVRDHD